MKRFMIVLILVVHFLSSPGYAEETWEKSFHWTWVPWGFGIGTMFIIPMILMLAFWVAVIIGIVYFVKWVRVSANRHDIKVEDTALDILKKRYAKGEITREEFEKMKRDIQ